MSKAFMALVLWVGVIILCLLTYFMWHVGWGDILGSILGIFGIGLLISIAIWISDISVS